MSNSNSEQVDPLSVPGQRWRRAHAHLPELARYLRAEARARLLHNACVAKAGRSGDLRGGRLWEDATAAERLANSLAADWGLTPLGRARLHEIAGRAELHRVDLARLWAQNAEADDRRTLLAADHSEEP